jgi:hypothetical protein
MARLVAIGAGGPAPELVRVMEELQPVVANLLPKPEVRMNGESSLMISYQVQTFKTHSNSMSGEFSKEDHDETGPTYKGFVLFVDVQPKGEVNQATTPQTLRRPYWQTYIDVTPVAGSDKQLYWGLSFGSRTDTYLLSQIRKALNDLQNARPRVKRTGGTESSRYRHARC